MKAKVENYYTDNHAKCLINKTINRIPSTIGIGSYQYSINPFRAIILEKSHYVKTREKLGLNRKFIAEPTLKSYKVEDFKSEESTKAFHEQNKTTNLDFGPCYWTQPYEKIKLESGIELEANESCIFICPELAKERAEAIHRKMHDYPEEDVYSHYLTVAVIHEIGHHALLSVLPIAERKKIDRVGEDLTLCEGLANWYAYHYTSTYEKCLLAQTVVDRSIAYRSYLTILHQNPAEVVQSLVVEKDYLKALTNFAKMLGGKVTGGMNLICNGRINTTNTVFMDDSLIINQMWNIVAKGGIDVLGPIWGNIITPSIEELSGRIPENTLIVTSHINKHPEYKKLPQNVVIMKEKRLHDIIDKFCNTKTTSTPQQHMISLLGNLGVEVKWIKQLIDYEKNLPKTTNGKS